MRGLEKDWHQGIIFTDDLDKVNAGVKLLGLWIIALMDDHPDIGDDTQQVAPVFLEVGECLLKAGGKEYLRSRPLAVLLLVLIEGFLEELAALGEHNLVEFGKIVRVVADRVLHQKNALDAYLEHVVVSVRRILKQFDDRKDKIGVAVPAEHEVHARTRRLQHPLPHRLGVMDQENERDAPTFFLKLGRKREYSFVLLVEHADDHVHLRLGAYDLPCLL